MKNLTLTYFVAVSGIALGTLRGQAIQILPASPAAYPVPIVDGNSPSVWVEDKLHVYTSTGDPLAMTGSDLFNLRQSASPVVTPREHYPIWIESIWRDDDGTLYAWYHHEPAGVCPKNSLTAPKIGALVSEDGGLTFRDLGIVLATGDPLNCSAGNGFFAGGHGDFSVILDQDRHYFYFLFDNYSGPPEHQGVAVARMPFENRAEPVGFVSKYYVGAWAEPGVGGFVTPVFPVSVSWERSNADALWGPSIHWNTHLNQYVVVLNRACCKSGWPQEGIYLSMNPDLSDPGLWTPPTKILDARNIGFAPGFYPQVFGLDAGGTDTLAGKSARLYVKGISKWEIEFIREDEPGGRPAPPPPPGPPDPPEFSDRGATQVLIPKAPVVGLRVYNR